MSDRRRAEAAANRPAQFDLWTWPHRTRRRLLPLLPFYHALERLGLVALIVFGLGGIALIETDSPASCVSASAQLSETL